jgi:hypothetical protein
MAKSRNPPYVGAVGRGLIAALALGAGLSVIPGTPGARNDGVWARRGESVHS